MKVQRPPPSTAAAIEQQRMVAEMQANGTLDVAAKLLSMAYLTFSRANAYVEEANAMLEPYGVVHKKVKTTVNNLMQSFDAYDKVMQGLLGGDKDANRQFCFDSDTLSELLDAFMANNIEVVRGPYFGAKLFLPSKG
jgi:hypothetical protein